MQPNNQPASPEVSGSWMPVVMAWLAVGLPLAWGVFMTFKKAALLFK
jgi:hypothetical protein